MKYKMLFFCLLVVGQLHAQQAPRKQTNVRRRYSTGVKKQPQISKPQPQRVPPRKTVSPDILRVRRTALFDAKSVGTIRKRVIPVKTTNSKQNHTNNK